MKVAVALVVDLLKNLRLQAQGITDTIRSGDDGFEYSCMEQIKDMLHAMDVFRVENLTPISKPDKNPVKAYQEPLPDDLDAHGFSLLENKLLYKHQLYHHLKQRLGELDLLNIPTSKLALHIEASLLYSSPYGKAAWSKQWFYATQHVLDDLAEEIKTERERAPQLVLFAFS